MSFWWCHIKRLPCCFCPSGRSDTSAMMPLSVTLHTLQTRMLMKSNNSFSLYLECESRNISATQRKDVKNSSLPAFNPHTSRYSPNEFCKKMHLWVMLSHVRGPGAHMRKVMWIIQLQFHINAALLQPLCCMYGHYLNCNNGEPVNNYVPPPLNRFVVSFLKQFRERIPEGSFKCKKTPRAARRCVTDSLIVRSYIFEKVVFHREWWWLSFLLRWGDGCWEISAWKVESCVTAEAEKSERETFHHLPSGGNQKKVTHELKH